MKVLLATSELHPYSKSGGLADMVGAMAKSLAARGLRVGVVTPLYHGIKERFPAMQELDWKLEIPLGNNLVRGTIWTLDPAPNLTIYFVDQPGYFDRVGLYSELGVDYPDNAERFIFFSKVVANLARYLPWKPDIIHGHDWQAGLVPLFVLHQKIWEGWGNAPKTCFTIHNLAYQGNFDVAQYGLTNLPWDYFHPQGIEFFGRVSCMKSGIVFSDEITTVSPRYANEITTAEFGCGLDGMLRQRAGSLAGILNGVDYSEWKTEGNPFLKAPFGVSNLLGKARNKAALQKEMKLPVRGKVPLFANISRLAEQKGVTIQLEALDALLADHEIQFVLLGSGAPSLEAAYRKLARKHPDKVAIRIGFDQPLSHRIEAGADFYLMPSQFEPCGLNQMYSLRYGTIPIVRRTGGLDDSVIDITEDLALANGVKFEEYSDKALGKAIRKALVIYDHPDLLSHYRRNAMKADFSWERTSGEYLEVYQFLTAAE